MVIKYLLGRLFRPHCCVHTQRAREGSSPIRNAESKTTILFFFWLCIPVKISRFIYPLKIFQVQCQTQKSCWDKNACFMCANAFIIAVYSNIIPMVCAENKVNSTQCNLIMKYFSKYLSNVKAYLYKLELENKMRYCNTLNLKMKTTNKVKWLLRKWEGMPQVKLANINLHKFSSWLRSFYIKLFILLWIEVSI